MFLPPLVSILVLETKGGMTHVFYPNSDFLHANPRATHWFKKTINFLRCFNKFEVYL